MAVITGINNGSLKELMSESLIDLKVAHNYLTSKLNGGSAMQVLVANNRGFRFALDYTRNNSLGFMEPGGGNLTRTMQPALDNMTANLQYMQYGQEITNLQLANSRSGVHVGPTAKALAAKKILEREAEMEEFYFCRGAGTQQISIVTATATVPVVGTETTVTCSGAADGLGTYPLGVNQRIRILDASLTFKSSGIITAKANNTTIGFTPEVVTTATIIGTDLIFPQSDATTATTVGPKGLPYLVKNTGPYFDKSLSTVTALKAIIDSATTTFSRTTMEALYRNSQARIGKKVNQRAVCSFAQYSNYYVQFYAQNSAQVHVVGDMRPGVDSGAAKNMDSYTFWGQPIDEYFYIHPANWWNLDYGTFCRLTLKDIGIMLTMPNEYQLKVASGEYANAIQSWDDQYLEFISDQPFRNAGFTALSFSGLPGLPKDSPFTGS